MEKQFKATIRSNGILLAEKIFVGSDEESKYMTKYFDIMMDPYITTVTIADTNAIFNFTYVGDTFNASIMYGLKNLTPTIISQTKQCAFCRKYLPSDKLVSGSGNGNGTDKLALHQLTGCNILTEDSNTNTNTNSNYDDDHYCCIDCETAGIDVPIHISGKSMISQNDEFLTVETKTLITQYETNDKLVKMHKLPLNSHLNVHFEGFCKRTIITLYDSIGTKIGTLSSLNQYVYYMPAHCDNDTDQYIVSWKCSLCKRLCPSRELSCCGRSKSAN